MAVKFNSTQVAEWKDAAIVLAGGAVAGAAAYEFNKYAVATNTTTGKANIEYVVSYPYLTGFLVAALGFGCLFIKNDMVKQLGLGLIAGGAAEGTAELMHKYMNTSSAS